MLSRRHSKILGGQAGFTLIEIIVVVGVIAILAAVIVPNLAKFTGTGEKGAKEVELDHVEDAFELMIAENQITSVTPHDKSNASTANSSWTALPLGGTGTQPLAGYLLNATTVYYYCYDANGNVSEQFNTPALCTLP